MRKRLKNNFFFSVIKRWVRSECSLRAAGLSLTSLIALVPLFIVGLAAFKYVGGVEKLVFRFEDFIIQYLAFGTHKLLIDKIQILISKINYETLGFFGVLTALLTCSKLFFQLDNSLRAIWQVRASFQSVYKVALFYVLLIIGPLSLSITAGLVSNYLLELSVKTNFVLPQWVRSEWLYSPFFFVPLTVLMKWLAPRKVRIKTALLVALITSILLFFAKEAYLLVTSEIVDYSRVYGSLAAFPLFLLWIVLIWQIILLGFTVCAEIELRNESNGLEISGEGALSKEKVPSQKAEPEIEL